MNYRTKLNQIANELKILGFKDDANNLMIKISRWQEAHDDEEYTCLRCDEPLKNADERQEGYCPDCAEDIILENDIKEKDSLMLHNEEYDNWNSLSDKERDDRINFYSKY